MDRNKTELTEAITRSALLWLDGKGFKPVETEVGVAPGWVADAAGVSRPTQTEMIELKLLKRAPAWRYDSDNAAYEAWKVARQAMPTLLTATIEVKTSVGDYRGDRKWKAAWPTNLCIVAMPEGMIDPTEYPPGWGVLLYSRDGSTLRRFLPSEFRPVTSEQQLDVVLALAVRRDHATRYARQRELQKAERVQAGERKTVGRVTDALRAVLAIQAGEPVEEALKYHRIKPEILPACLLDELRKAATRVVPQPEKAAGGG